MVDKALVEYIRKVLAANQFNDRVKGILINKGWTSDEINQAFSEATSENLEKIFQQAKNPFGFLKKIDPKLLMLGTIIIAAAIIFAVFFIIYLNNSSVHSSNNLNSNNSTFQNVSSQSAVPPKKVNPTSGNTSVKTPEGNTTLAIGSAIDCGTDMACFNASEKYCNQTNAIYTLHRNFMGMLISEKSIVMLNNTKKKGCAFSLKIINFTMAFSDETKQTMMMQNSSLTYENITNYEKNLTETAKSNYLGKSFTCISNKTDYASEIINTFQNSPENTTSLLKDLNCTGSFMDIIHS